MLQRFQIGNAEIFQITEYVGPTHPPESTLAGFNRDQFNAALTQLPPDHYFASVDKLVIALTIWVMKIDGKVIVIDTGVGNGKTRPAARMNGLNTLVLEWCRAIGAGPDQVTHVLLTHMHNDHLGWCTVKSGDTWVPTFPKARYIASQVDFDHFKALYEKDGGKTDGGSFEDAIIPLQAAGQLDLIGPGTLVADHLTAGDVGGHTPGMLSFGFESNGERGLFCADILHHPVQICHPEWNTVFCMQPERAIASRARVLNDVADTDTLLMPCHFPAPGCGYIERREGGFAYRPRTSGKIPTIQKKS